MNKSNFLLYIFLFLSKKVLSQFPPGLNITQCSPVPAAVYIEQFAQLQLQTGCQSLELPYQGILNLSCCEIEFKEKKNSSAQEYMDVCHFYRIILIITDMKI